MKSLSKIFIVVTTLSICLSTLSSCGSSDGSGGNNVQPRNAAWSGTVNSNRYGSLSARAIIYPHNGTTYLIVNAATSSIFTPISVSGTDLKHTGRCVAGVDENTFGFCSVSASNISEGAISGSYTSNSGDSGTFSINAQNFITSTGALSGTWTFRTLDATDSTATFSSLISSPSSATSSSGCNSITPSLNTQLSTNSFAVYSVTVSGCKDLISNGTYTYVVSLISNNEGVLFAGRVVSGIQAWFSIKMSRVL